MSTAARGLPPEPSRRSDGWRATALRFLSLGLLSCLSGSPLFAAGPAAPPAAAPAIRMRTADAAGFLKIEAALPVRPAVPPKKPRRLLIFDRNVGYGGHPSIVHANHAFTRMGEKTGAFSTVVSRDPAVFKPESLRQFDAVFLNNTVGNLFEEPDLRQSLLEFILGGGGLLGVHGTSVAFTRWPGAIEDWPEFGRMIGARGANHRDSTEHVFIRLDDPGHPINRIFGGKGFDYRDEFFRVHEPYSRRRVRVLLSIDTEKTDVTQGQARGDCLRADHDYALAWIRNYGRGRIFYCTIAHNPYVFWDPVLLPFYLDAIQFALGDLPAPTTPSGLLTPAVRAQEQLGWRLGTEAIHLGKTTLFEAIDEAARLGLLYLGASNGQTISGDLPKPLDPGLSDEELRAIRFRLDAAAVRLLTYSVESLPTDEAGLAKLFAFGRKLGFETFVADAPPAALEAIERWCNQYDLRLALRASSAQPSGTGYHRPEGILKACRKRGPRIGACGDVAQWLAASVDPAKAIAQLGDRLLTVRMPDLRPTPAAHRRAGVRSDPVERVVRAVHRQGRQPMFFSLAEATARTDASDQRIQSINAFNLLSLELANP